MEDEDTGNIWEYLDWTLSVSSNSAAAMTMRDAMILRRLGRDYPLPEEKISPFFDAMPGSERTRLFQETFWAPVTANGMSLDQIRQGSFFTREGKRIVAGGGLSYASARSLMQFLLAMEKGQLVDEQPRAETPAVHDRAANSLRLVAGAARRGDLFQIRLALQLQARGGFQVRQVQGQPQELHELGGHRRGAGR